jgi:hypothetical protein
MKRWIRRQIFRLILVASILVALLNVSVRTLGGGTPHLLSVYHLDDKAHAVSALVLHLLRHPFRSCEPVFGLRLASPRCALRFGQLCAAPRSACPDRAALRCAVPDDAYLVLAAKRQNLPADFVVAIARAESDRRAHAISAAGAMGWMQIMPDTARDLELDDPFDPKESADAGARYLSKLWRRYGGDRRRIAAAYNAGPGAIPVRGPLDLGGETKLYVRRVLGR